MERMKNNCVKRCMSMNTEEGSERDRPKKIWGKVIREDLRLEELNRYNCTVVHIIWFGELPSGYYA